MMLENINRGTGAGGSNTNKSGLSFEKNTHLRSNYQVLFSNNDGDIIQFENSKDRYITKEKITKEFINIFHSDPNFEKPHGCKKPDEMYYRIKDFTIFIIEKKNQNVSGSVCEKIQTGIFKKMAYQEIYPNNNIVYIYCLSLWFKDNCRSEINLLKKNGIHIFFGDDINYKNDLINFIINYK